jgi:hypothetical protein
MVDDDRENAEDYGSSFSDWSPDPEDYLTWLKPIVEYWHEWSLRWQ